MRTNEFIVDDFVIAQERILPLFMIVVFLVPVYRLISLIVTERQNKTKDVARSMGIKESAYWLSWFLYFFIGVTAVTLAQALMLAHRVFQYSEFLPIFLCLWLYGLSLFGYIILIQSLFTKPTLASIFGSLLFFASSFIEAVVEDPFLGEHHKLLASVMPSVTI